MNWENVILPMSLRVTIIELEKVDVPLAAWRPSDFRIPLLRIAIQRPGLIVAIMAAFAYQPAQERRRDRDRSRRALPR